MRSGPRGRAEAGDGVWQHHTGIEEDGRVVEAREGAIGGDGKYGSVLDTAIRSAGEPRCGSATDRYAAIVAGTGAKDGHVGLPVDPVLAQSWFVEGVFPAPRNRSWNCDRWCVAKPC